MLISLWCVGSALRMRSCNAVLTALCPAVRLTESDRHWRYAAVAETISAVDLLKEQATAGTRRRRYATGVMGTRSRGGDGG